MDEVEGGDGVESSRRLLSTYGIETSLTGPLGSDPDDERWKLASGEKRWKLNR